MNKKLLSVAVAAAVGAPMAVSAEATIYGSLHIATTNIDRSSKTVFPSASKSSDKFWTQTINDGQVGIQGSEDLGNGLKALYKVEYNIDSYDDATQSGASMSSLDEVWLGLSGDWGTVLVGQEDTPYKTFMDSAGVDILGDSIVDVDTMLRTVGAEGFERHTGAGVVAYVSPNFSGFTFGAAIVTGGQTGTPDSPTNTGSLSFGTGTVKTGKGGLTSTTFGGTPTIDISFENNNDGFAEHYSIGANYTAGGLRVGGGYENKVRLTESLIGRERDEKTAGIGASYTFGAFQVGAKYEDAKNTGAATATSSGYAGQSPSQVIFYDAKRYAITGKWTTGNFGVGAVYSREDLEGTAASATNVLADIDIKGYGLFGEYNFSNRTKVYAAYSDVESDPKSSEDEENESKRFAIGVIHNF